MELAAAAVDFWFERLPFWLPSSGWSSSLSLTACMEGMFLSGLGFGVAPFLMVMLELLGNPTKVGVLSVPDCSAFSLSMIRCS